MPVALPGQGCLDIGLEKWSPILVEFCFLHSFGNFALSLFQLLISTF